jgi:hypothetical protein
MSSTRNHDMYVEVLACGGVLVFDEDVNFIDKNESFLWPSRHRTDLA